MTSTSEPIVWREKERLDGEIVDCLTAILRTRGCRWNRCYMCGYTSEAYPASEEELIQQVEKVFSQLEGEQVLKVFTSGSFFDDEEVTPKVREFLLQNSGKGGLESSSLRAGLSSLRMRSLNPSRE